jgi:hypothetical protein
MPVLDTRQPLFAFANVVYGSGVCLSSNLVSVIPDDLGRARATDAPTTLIDDVANGVDGWVTSSPATDPVPPVPSLLQAAVGPGGKPGITVTRAIPITTHKVGDPKWRGPAGAELRFSVFARATRTVRVVLHEKEFALGWTRYVRELRLTPGEGWQTVTLRSEDFTTERGERLKGWETIRMLELDSKGGPGEEPVYAGFRWLPGR